VNAVVIATILRERDTNESAERSRGQVLRATSEPLSTSGFVAKISDLVMATTYEDI
jgi:hypothetical protein